ncbi:MAG: family 43 glycosylhydrolase [Clostridiales bacterium]|jgi:hypothetical protein|nr:family 43 glycosylhydrolase [Clostridiales bacterium]
MKNYKALTKHLIALCLYLLLTVFQTGCGAALTDENNQLQVSAGSEVITESVIQAGSENQDQTESSSAAESRTASASELSANPDKTEETVMQSLNKIITSVMPEAGKATGEANPLITNMYCADPTAIEYEGRLYVYGTNDTQQYLHNTEGSNSYEKIKSLIMISTDDMVNWTYHGTIETGKISPWIIASWAPSIVSRVEEDGKTHFYLYYSNSGWGVGVLTATSPTGPWEDPLGKSIIDGNTKGIGKTAPFDPGVVIDENGVGWLSFGGSESGEDDDVNFMPGGARIVQLGEDMISLASEISEIPAPYHFEANEMNYINGTYVYTYNTSWANRVKWEIKDDLPPPACSMCYMTTNTPLVPESWVYRGYYFKNPGENGLDYSNNHSHLQKYGGRYYLFYHTLSLQRKLGVGGGFRSIFADEIEVDEENLKINTTRPTSIGMYQIKPYDPYKTNTAAALAASAGLSFEADGADMFVTSNSAGSWELIREADFAQGASKFTAKVKGTGLIEIRLDSLEADPVGYAQFSTADWENLEIDLAGSASGVHDLYFVFSDEKISMYSWSFQTAQ